MVLKKEGGQYIFQKRWGRLRHGILPVNTKKIEQVISNQRVGLDQFINNIEDESTKVLNDKVLPSDYKNYVLRKINRCNNI